METGVYQVNLKDGRVFRIFYANSAQKAKLFESLYNLKGKIELGNNITNGIHTLKEWKEISKTI